jgi:hypothetical protein
MGLHFKLIAYIKCFFLIPKGPWPFFSKNTPNLQFLAQVVKTTLLQFQPYDIVLD